MTVSQETPFIGVVPSLAKALTQRGYSALTPVQEAILKPELDEADLLVSAQTGSGKTVAFGIALAPTLLGKSDKLREYGKPLALVIAPTRELALQVSRELEWLYGMAGAKLATCVGGMDMRDERRALARGAHIVVGTPGRLCDHIKRGTLEMGGLKGIVLDEADEMLKMGFREELELILGAAPQQRRTLMFSATVPKTILGMAKKYQKDAVRVNTAAEAKQHMDIQYRVMTVAAPDRENAIINVLRYYDAKNAIVFGDTRVAVNKMVSRFNNRGFSVVALSGELSQKERTNALQSLRDGRAQVCIATDVAARGLDLPDLELVIHADIPKNAEALLHRSGRTGRAGRKGVSALIIPYQARKRTERLLMSAKIKAEWGTPPSVEDVIEKDNERMVGNPALSEAVGDDEREIVDKLLSTYSVENIAAAFVRQYRADRSAPEELIDAGDAHHDHYKDDRRSSRGKGRQDGEGRGPRSTRGDFADGVWFSLNLGRKQKAEPRWILPMLCKSGGLKKANIGAIKISETRTFVEISANGVDQFVENIGPQGKIEKAITASRLEGKPDFSQADQMPSYKPRDKSQYPKRAKDKKQNSNTDEIQTQDNASFKEQEKDSRQPSPKSPVKHVSKSDRKMPKKDAKPYSSSGDINGHPPEEEFIGNNLRTAKKPNRKRGQKTPRHDGNRAEDQNTGFEGDETRAPSGKRGNKKPKRNQEEKSKTGFKPGKKVKKLPKKSAKKKKPKTRTNKPTRAMRKKKASG